MRASCGIFKLSFLIGVLILIVAADAEILEESGSLEGFLTGTCETCGYDNLVSHIVEGIAREDFNVCSPLDVQTTGFGEHIVIPEDPAGDALLAVWRSLFDLLARHQWEAADTLLEDSLSDYPYELVHFEEQGSGTEYYILREQLDSSFVDSNDVENPLDDEIGSFTHSWGVYIFRVEAEYPNAMVQVVHPNDDYISLYVALDMFETLNAGQFFISTVGREVVWEGTSYNNNTSLSDPSRNGHHVFQMAHEAVTDYYADEVPDRNPLLIQVHSFDTRRRPAFPSAIVALSYNDTYYNLPVYDWSGVVGGMIDRTPWQVHPAGVIGNAEPVTLTEFFGAWSHDDLIVFDDNHEQHYVENNEFLHGYFRNQQTQYRGPASIYNSHEWVIHIECDELPACIEDSTELEFYGGAGYPVSAQNFAAIADYYHPLAENLKASLDSIVVYIDTEFSNPPTNLWPTQVQDSLIYLRWYRGSDPNFESYVVHYDTTPELNEQSQSFDEDDYLYLQSCRSYGCTITGLIPDHDYYFAITARDQFGHESEISEVIHVVMNSALRVVSPDSNSIWIQNTQQMIRWQGFPLGPAIWIELNRSFPEGEWELLAGNIVSFGGRLVTVNGPVSDRCVVWIHSADTTAQVYSQVFTIADPNGYLIVEDVSEPDLQLTGWNAGSLECPDNALLGIKLKNLGLTDINISGLSLASGTAFELATDCPVAFALAPLTASECDLTISFAVEDAGLYRDTLVIITDAINADGGIFSFPLEAYRTVTPMSPEIVLSRENNSIRISWMPVSQTIQGCPINPRYWVWCYLDDWDGRCCLDAISDTTYLHDAVLNTEGRLFYKVEVYDADNELLISPIDQTLSK